jgi:hypothetical protein
MDKELRKAVDDIVSAVKNGKYHARPLTTQVSYAQFGWRRKKRRGSVDARITKRQGAENSPGEMSLRAD